jgi:hypothetical protein
MPGARRLLGRPHAPGCVVMGDQRGPDARLTANLRPPRRALPRTASTRSSPGSTANHPAVLNIGVRPTFAGRRRTSRRISQDFDGDLIAAGVVKLILRLRRMAADPGAAHGDHPPTWCARGKCWRAIRRPGAAASRGSPGARRSRRAARLGKHAPRSSERYRRWGRGREPSSWSTRAGASMAGPQDGAPGARHEVEVEVPPPEPMRVEPGCSAPHPLRTSICSRSTNRLSRRPRRRGAAWDGERSCIISECWPVSASNGGIVHRLDRYPRRSAGGTDGGGPPGSPDSSRTLDRQALSRYRPRLAEARPGGSIDRSGHPRERQRMSVQSPGRAAVTHWTVLERFRDATFVRLRPEASRTHQLRVHLAATGIPSSVIASMGPARERLTRSSPATGAPRRRDWIHASGERRAHRRACLLQKISERSSPHCAKGAPARAILPVSLTLSVCCLLSREPPRSPRTEAHVTFFDRAAGHAGR